MVPKRRSQKIIQGVFYYGPPSTSSKYKKVNLGKVRFGVSRTIYVNVDSPNLGFGEAQCKKTPCITIYFTLFSKQKVTRKSQNRRLQ